MKSQGSKFKFLNRGFAKNLVLIPGWATDFRVFSNLELNYNYILPIKFNPFGFREDLLRFLNKSGIDKISFFGWSLGGFLAASFAAKNPQRTEGLILCSIRQRYDKPLLKEIVQKLKQNKKAFLYKLYLACFSSVDRKGLGWFKKHLLNNYLAEMKTKDLLVGLDYLREARIEPQSLLKIKNIRILHGDVDKIAPIDEARWIKSALPQAEFVSLSGAGHNPFFNQKFIEILRNGQKEYN